MKKLIMIIALISCIGLSGCYSAPSSDQLDDLQPSDDGRFAIVAEEGIQYTNNYAIILDTETGVQYIWIKPYDRDGVAFPLYNTDGTVSTVEVEEE